jgi:predicted RNA-binding protein with PIN domain
MWKPRIIQAADLSAVGQQAVGFSVYNSNMALLIDGYNLLHVTGIFGAAGAGTDLHRSRMALLDFLAASIDERERKQTTIVFDAAGAPPGLQRTFTHRGITVQFARRRSNADEMIEELLEECLAPRGLVVISSDHGVQRAARRRGASYIDSDQWYADLHAARQRRENIAEEPIAKSHGDSSRDEVAYWIGEFGSSPRDDTPTNPFPPGYADDVLDE